MAKQSILTGDMEHCAVCGKPYPEVHHVMYGNSNRKWSEKYKLVIGLCGEHHRGTLLSPHFNRHFDLELKKYAQERFQEEYPDLDFIKIFGRNYL